MLFKSFLTFNLAESFIGSYFNALHWLWLSNVVRILPLLYHRGQFRDFFELTLVLLMSLSFTKPFAMIHLKHLVRVQKQ